MDIYIYFIYLLYTAQKDAFICKRLDDSPHDRCWILSFDRTRDQVCRRSSLTRTLSRDVGSRDQRSKDRIWLRRDYR